MAISIAAVLKSHGHIHQDALSKRFVRRFERDPERGYGKMTRVQLRENLAGQPWQVTSPGAFGGRGSMGNGGAMRVAPLGGYFADDLDRVVKEAKASSVVTHVHPEGVAAPRQLPSLRPWPGNCATERLQNGHKSCLTQSCK
jgi:ADP-ribosylglycohydrolase